MVNVKKMLMEENIVFAQMVEFHQIVFHHLHVTTQIVVVLGVLQMNMVCHNVVVA